MENKEFIKLPNRVVRRELIKEVVKDDECYVDLGKKTIEVSIKTYEDEYNYYGEKGVEVYEDVLNQLGFGEGEEVIGQTVETGEEVIMIPLDAGLKLLSELRKEYESEASENIGGGRAREIAVGKVTVIDRAINLLRLAFEKESE